MSEPTQPKQPTPDELDPDEALQLDADPDHEPSEVDPDLTPVVNPDDPNFVAPGQDYLQ